MAAQLKRIIGYISIIGLMVGILVFAFAGHELVRITGPGNMGGNSIRYLYMMLLLPVVIIGCLLSLIMIRSRDSIAIALILLLLNGAYTVLSFLYCIQFYLDAEGYNIEHDFPGELPPPLHNYLIVVGVNLLLIFMVRWKQKRLKLTQNS